MTTNVWLTQVSLMKSYSQSFYVLLNVLSLELELNHIHSSLNVEQTAPVIVLQTYSADNDACN